jgi:alpha-amylase
MPAICFYFQVHQPYRLRPYSFFDIGEPGPARYFDEGRNAEIVKRVAAKCYVPVNRLLLNLIHRHEGRFSVAFSITGTALDQIARYTPQVLASFDALAETGHVEFLAETDNHSLSALYSWSEFEAEVAAHRSRITSRFGRAPVVFRNTELIYSDALAPHVERLGFAGVLCDGVPRILGGRTPGRLFRAAGTERLVVLTKYPQLSDDIAFRFSDRNWKEWPLTAPKFASWVRALEGNFETVNLFMDYETFGEHQWSPTGVLEFLSALPEAVLRYPENRFATPGELVRSLAPVGELSSPDWISWADVDRDLTAWVGNDLQKEAARAIYELQEPVLARGDEQLITTWRRLLTSDHFYYMCLKWFADGDVHKYFSPYQSPYDAYIYYMNVVNDLRWRLGLDHRIGRHRSAAPAVPAAPAAPAAPALPAAPPAPRMPRRTPRRSGGA